MVWTLGVEVGVVSEVVPSAVAALAEEGVGAVFGEVEVLGAGERGGNWDRGYGRSCWI